MGKGRKKKKGANVTADGIPAAFIKKVERIHKIFRNFSPKEIYETLVDCNMREDFVIDRLLSQVKSNQDDKKETTDTSDSCSQGVDSSIQNSELGDGGGHDGDQGGENKLHSDDPIEVKSNQDEKKETTDTSDSCSHGVDSSIQNSELGDGGGHDGDQGGENKLHSDETSNEQGTTNQLADLSTTSSNFGPYKSDLTNVEITTVPISSAKAVRPPTYSTYVHVVLNVTEAPEENVTAAPEENVTEAPEENVTEACSQGVDSIIQNSELGDGGGHDGDQGGENKLHSDETSNEQGTTNQLADLSTTSSNLCPSKSDLTNVEITTVPISSAEAQNVTEAPLKDDSLSHEKPVATNPSSNAITEPNADQLWESASSPYPNLPDDEDVTNPYRHLYKMYAAGRDQFQESASVSNVMHQQPSTIEAFPLYSTFPFNESMPPIQSDPTASLLGTSPSDSMIEAFINFTDCKPQSNQQDKNYNYSQPNFLSGHYINMLNSPYWRPKQNDSYNRPPSPAFQQRGGSNNNNLAPDGYMMDSPYPQPEQNNSYNYMPQSPHQSLMNSPHQSQNSMLTQYRNSNLPQSGTSIDPSAHGSAYGTAYYTSSDNAANQRFGYEDVSSNQLPSTQHQSVDSNVLPVQGESPHPRSPSFRQSQQVQQPYRGIANERSSAYYTSQNQLQNRSDPSDQTQQRLRRRDNN